MGGYMRTQYILYYCSNNNKHTQYLLCVKVHLYFVYALTTHMMAQTKLSYKLNTTHTYARA